ncbi:MAG: IS630 family transposase [Deferribacteres bacterium]|nr:IS630 family transposase [Deferribacteres bacterium]
MKENDGRYLKLDTLHYVRKQAIKLFKQGKNRGQIAEILGVNRNSVGTWVKLYQAHGMQALKLEQPGRKTGSGRRLNADQEKAIQKMIYDKMPDQLKLPFALWTRQAIQQLIKEQFGIELPVRTINHYLHRWNFTPQRPIKRAYEQNDKKVQEWLHSSYPAIDERAKQENAEIHWGDETGISNQCNYGRSYAPKGQTPVVRRKANRFSTSMISSITKRGKVRFMCYQGAMNSDIFLRFLKRLVKDSHKKVFLIIDNLPVHHSKPVKEWLADNLDKIELFYLPSYSPERNPDEYLNRDLKQNVANKPPAKNKEQLKSQIISHMKAIQRKAEHVKTYFKNPNVAYAQ